MQYRHAGLSDLTRSERYARRVDRNLRLMPVARGQGLTFGVLEQRCLGQNGLFRCASRAKRKRSLQDQGDGGDKRGDGDRGEIVVWSVT